MLTPDALELGVRRSLLSTLALQEAQRAEGKSTYLAVPIDHLPALSEIDYDISGWCIALDGSVYNDGKVAVICTMPRDEPHACFALGLRGAADRSTSALFFSPLYYEWAEAITARADRERELAR